MDFSMIGSIRNYTKSLELQAKWNQKKASGDVTSHETTERNMIQRQVNEDRDRDKIRKIMAKLDAGVKLTEDERKILKEEEPEAYQDLEEREREQRQFERSLKQCRTKEDVQRLKMSKLGSSMAKLKEVEHNPNISLEKKLRIFVNEKNKLDKFEESTREFVKSGEYEKLPDEAEVAKARQEEREAEEAKRNPETEETKPVDKAEKPEQDEEGKPEEVGAAETASKPTETAETGSKPSKTVETGTKLSEPAEERPTIETESPEARKVRRAKAKSAYGGQTKPPEMPRPQTLDLRG